MKRLMLFAGSLVIGLLFLFGCSGDEGKPGPAGVSGVQPMKVLSGGYSPIWMQEVVAGILKYGDLVPGSEIHTVDLTDSVPPVAVLRQYDAVLVWTLSLPYPDSLGDALADYVDGGGAVVVGPPSNITGFSGSEITGRFVTPGYSPWVNGPSAGIGTDPRVINFASLSQPLHKIFNGTDPQNLDFWSNMEIASPGVEATATLIAMDGDGANAIAVNANGRVIGLNIFPPYQYEYGHADALRLIGNALRCAAGNF